MPQLYEVKAFSRNVNLVYVKGAQENITPHYISKDGRRQKRLQLTKLIAHQFCARTITNHLAHY